MITQRPRMISVCQMLGARSRLIKSLLSHWPGGGGLAGGREGEAEAQNPQNERRKGDGRKQRSTDDEEKVQRRRRGGGGERGRTDFGGERDSSKLACECDADDGLGSCSYDRTSSPPPPPRRPRRRARARPKATTHQLAARERAERGERRGHRQRRGVVRVRRRVLRVGDEPLAWSRDDVSHQHRLP